MAKSVEIIPATKEQWTAKKTWRTAAYCRVSTACEEQMGSLAVQQQFYVSMIEAHPDWINAGIFSDQSTGLNAAKRPGFQAMLRLCRKQRIDLIFTKSFSRLGRNTLDMMRAIREFRRLKVDVYFEKEGVWLHQQEADLLLTAYCAIS